MLFHWFKHYGKQAPGATAVVDSVFTKARAAAPAVFAADSFQDTARKAKFEHMCPFLAQALAALPAGQGAQRRAILEAMIDRIEIGLREGAVSDMRVGNEVRTYAAALNGRMQRYVPLLEAQNWPELTTAMAEHGVGAPVAKALQQSSPKKAA